MRDFKKYLGREVSVMTSDNTVQGTLEEVGHHSLTIKPAHLFFSDGQPSEIPKGRIIVDRWSIVLMQVI